MGFGKICVFLCSALIHHITLGSATPFVTKEPWVKEIADGEYPLTCPDFLKEDWEVGNEWVDECLWFSEPEQPFGSLEEQHRDEGNLLGQARLGSNSKINKRNHAPDGSITSPTTDTTLKVPKESPSFSNSMMVNKSARTPPLSALHLQTDHFDLGYHLSSGSTYFSPRAQQLASFHKSESALGYLDHHSEGHDLRSSRPFFELMHQNDAFKNQQGQYLGTAWRNNPSLEGQTQIYAKTCCTGELQIEDPVVEGFSDLPKFVNFQPPLYEEGQKCEYFAHVLPEGHSYFDPDLVRSLNNRDSSSQGMFRQSPDPFLVSPPPTLRNSNLWNQRFNGMTPFFNSDKVRETVLRCTDHSEKTLCAERGPRISTPDNFFDGNRNEIHDPVPKNWPICQSLSGVNSGLLLRQERFKDLQNVYISSQSEHLPTILSATAEAKLSPKEFPLIMVEGSDVTPIEKLPISQHMHQQDLEEQNFMRFEPFISSQISNSKPSHYLHVEKETESNDFIDTRKRNHGSLGDELHEFAPDVKCARSVDLLKAKYSNSLVSDYITSIDSSLCNSKIKNKFSHPEKYLLNLDRGHASAETGKDLSRDSTAIPFGIEENQRFSTSVSDSQYITATEVKLNEVPEYWESHKDILRMQESYFFLKNNIEDEITAHSEINPSLVLDSNCLTSGCNFFEKNKENFLKNQTTEVEREMDSKSENEFFLKVPHFSSTDWLTNSHGKSENYDTLVEKFYKNFDTPETLNHQVKLSSSPYMGKLQPIVFNDLEIDKLCVSSDVQVKCSKNENQEVEIDQTGMTGEINQTSTHYRDKMIIESMSVEESPNDNVDTKMNSEISFYDHGKNKLGSRNSGKILSEIPSMYQISNEFPCVQSKFPPSSPGALQIFQKTQKFKSIPKWSSQLKLDIFKEIMKGFPPIVSYISYMYSNQIKIQMLEIWNIKVRKKIRSTVNSKMNFISNTEILSEVYVKSFHPFCLSLLMKYLPGKIIEKLFSIFSFFLTGIITDSMEPNFDNWNTASKHQFNCAVIWISEVLYNFSDEEFLLFVQKKISKYEGKSSKKSAKVFPHNESTTYLLAYMTGDEIYAVRHLNYMKRRCCETLIPKFREDYKAGYLSCKTNLEPIEISNFNYGGVLEKWFEIGMKIDQIKDCSLISKKEDFKYKTFYPMAETLKEVFNLFQNDFKDLNKQHAKYLLNPIFRTEKDTLDFISWIQPQVELGKKNKKENIFDSDIWNEIKYFLCFVVPASKIKHTKFYTDKIYSLYSSGMIFGERSVQNFVIDQIKDWSTNQFYLGQEFDREHCLKILNLLYKYQQFSLVI